MRARGATTAAAEWDEVWADYDRRHPRRAQKGKPEPAPDVTRPAFGTGAPPPARSTTRRPSWRVALGAATLAGVAWLGLSGATVWQAAAAVERRDAIALAQHMDVEAVQAGLRQSLTRLANRPETPDAAAFLAGMAEDIAGAWATPAGLAEVARVRGVSYGAANEALRAARPVGLTALELPMGTPVGAAPPITLRMELRDGGMAPRWQVTEVRVSAEARDVPPVSPMRVSQLR